MFNPFKKKKEFTKTVEELAKQIEGIDELAAAYTRGLTQEGTDTTQA